MGNRFIIIVLIIVNIIIVIVPSSSCRPEITLRIVSNVAIGFSDLMHIFCVHFYLAIFFPHTLCGILKS